jgi:speckle-type POZ protein
VLAARSAVFKAQVFGTTEEGATAPSVVKIDDIKADVFRGLLKFIYTDALSLPWVEDEDNMEVCEASEEEGNSSEDDGAEIEGDEEMSSDEMWALWLLQLLEAADRYDLQKLKSICEEMLVSRFSLTLTSVADFIVVAERRGCRLLQEFCLEFIKSQTSLHKVFTADCLDQIIKTCSPSALKEILSKFAAS